MKLVAFLSFASLVIAGNSDGTDCTYDPSQSSCKSYKLPTSKIEPMIRSVCEEHSDLAGCSLDKICSARLSPRLGYCSHFSILSDLCRDVPSSSGCRVYSTLCQKSSVVEQCEEERGLDLPTTGEISKRVDSICESHGDAVCKSHDKPLIKYSKLCHARPSSSECKDWANVCGLVDSEPFLVRSLECSVTEAPEAIRPYFHFGNDKYMFKNWELASTWKWLFGLMTSFTLGVLFQLTRNSSDGQTLGFTALDSDTEPTTTHRPGFFRRVSMSILSKSAKTFYDLLRTLVLFATIITVVTFNVPLLLSLLAGVYTGSLTYHMFYTPRRITLE